MSMLACGLLQMDPSQFDSAHDFHVSLTARISSLSRAGAGLIVLPAYSVMVGLALQLEAEGRSPCNPFELARLAGTDGFSVWMDFFAAAALSNRTYLCPGTFIASCDGGFEHRAPLFSPDGDLVLVQLQTHVSDAESQAGMAVGADLAVVDICGHKVGIAIGTDAWYPEVGRILAPIRSWLRPRCRCPTPSGAKLAGSGRLSSRTRSSVSRPPLADRGWARLTRAVRVCSLP